MEPNPYETPQSDAGQEPTKADSSRPYFGRVGEWLVVVSIIAILVYVFLPAVGAARNKPAKTPSGISR